MKEIYGRFLMTMCLIFLPILVLNLLALNKYDYNFQTKLPVPDIIALSKDRTEISDRPINVLVSLL